MSINQISPPEIDDITVIRDQVFAGKAALEPGSQKRLFQSFRSQLQQIVKDDLFTIEPEQVKIWQEIFAGLFSGQLAHDLAAKLIPNHYYNFGKYLERLYNNRAVLDSGLLELTRAYLDILRLPEFLTKIYGEKRWESLILALIDKSNFTVANLFKQRIRDYENKALFKLLRGSAETDYSWRQVGVLVESYSLALAKSLSQHPGKVAFLMENSLQMALLDIACLTAGIVNIMIPANLVPRHIAYILNQTQASLLLVSDEKQLTKVRSIKKEIPHIKQIVLLLGTSAEERVMSFKEFVASGLTVDPAILNEWRSQVKMDSLATIMYTSGTTGEPKGIMFSQMNIVYKRFCRALAIPEIGDHDRFLAYLPLYHTFGRWLELMGSIFWGASYAFMENPAVETMIANMNLVKPTIFISIPKKWLQLCESIASRVDVEVEDEQVILQTVHDVTGGKLRWGLSAAGFLPADIFQFMQKYGIELMSGFGMTEATGGITMTPPRKYRANSLGVELPGIEIKVAADGELMVRGPYVMLGYYDQPKQKTFTIDGWFPTGDVMRMDKDGFIEIIDRKKEIYKNIKGETIAPQKIENYFRDFEFVKQVFLVGDHRPFNTVLIYPNDEMADSVLSNMTDSQKQEYFSSVIVTVNKFLAPFERIVDFRLIERPLTAEHGELTPKGTFKRRVIERNFDKVTEEMYSKNYTSITISGMEIRIPNWFLREKGCLSGDIIAMPNGLSIPKLQAGLKIEKAKKGEKIYRIGDYLYEINSSYIDLQILLTNPVYWLGNQDFFEFAGEGIYLWYRQDILDKKIKFSKTVVGKLIDDKIKEKMKAIMSAGEQSLFGLHCAVILLQSNLITDGLLAVRYLYSILEDETLLIYKIAMRLLYFPNITELLSVRRELFKVAAKKKKHDELKDILELYLSHNNDLLDDSVVHTIVDIGRGAGVIEAVENLIQKEVSRLAALWKSGTKNTPLPSLFNLLANYGIHHPTSAKRIRQIIVQYQLRKTWPALSRLADQARTHLQEGFRNWLGSNQSIAVDVETGKEYEWSDVIITEEDIDPGDKERIVKALSETSILHEAIFLFSEGTLVRLNDILPGGVWVSLIGTYPDKTAYRISIQTRFQGSFEIVFNLNKTNSKAEVLEEASWLILAGSRHYIQELAEDFGAYWEEFDLWSAKFISGDTVGKFLRRESRKKDERTQTRLYYLWPFFVWNAAASYTNFWKLTGYKLQFENPATSLFVIPNHDYQTRTHVLSFSERAEFTNLVDFFDNFYRKFIKFAEDEYPFLKRKSIWNYVFSGVINAEGEETGIQLLNRFLSELQESNKIEESDLVREKLQKFLQTIEVNGFIPKQMYFAIKRFHRWFLLNSDASLSARAQTLYELFETYHLPELEKIYPETRTRFFLETIFRNSAEQLKKTLRELITKQHKSQLSKEATLAFISDIQSDFDLTESEAFFLTRLSYPHLKPTDSAALLKTKSEDTPVPNLLVQLEDYDGNLFSIRKPISPKEISRLHQLFIDANLLVHFHSHHQFLVAVSERGYIIGGLFYGATAEDTIHMEKIVVADRYRRKGISEGLMNEFFNRMKSENFSYVTTGFFRPEYFYRFGFKVERKYSGLVKEL